ncbi:MAG: hypothetical protein PHR51_01240 [Patescibacteria group bacterium]|nr:hypothetical protein [Patescibacteria group bacterium]
MNMTHTINLKKFLLNVGITSGLAIIALFMGATKVDAATFVGNITLGWGQAAVVTETNGLLLIDEGLTVDQALDKLGQGVRLEGILTDTDHLIRISSIVSTVAETVLYTNNALSMPIENTADRIMGLLTQNIYTPDQVTLSFVTPEVYAGSKNYLRVSLTDLGGRNMQPYIEQKATVEGLVRPTKDGTWECVVSRIWVNETEI